MAFIDVPPDLPVAAVVQTKTHDAATAQGWQPSQPVTGLKSNQPISQSAADLAGDFVISVPARPSLSRNRQASESQDQPLVRPSTNESGPPQTTPDGAVAVPRQTLLGQPLGQGPTEPESSPPAEAPSADEPLNSGHPDTETEPNPEPTNTDPSGDAASESTESSPTDPMSDPEAPTAPDSGPAALDITADYQDYDPQRQVVTARGNVLLRLNDAILQAEKIWVNLLNRFALAEDNVLLTRGEQIIRGQRAEYNFIQGSGVLFEAQGELFLPALNTDFASPLEGPTTSRSVFDPLNPDRPLSDVSGTGGLEFSTSPGRNFSNAEGGIRRLRFEADQVNFDSDLWEAEGVRITNDPFSPPELEFRADSITIETLSAEQDLLTAKNPRLVFDQGFSLPLLRSQFTLNRGTLDPEELNPLPTGIGIDGRDRGGLFIERRFALFKTPNADVGVTPQYLPTRAFSQGLFDADAFGLGLDANARLGPRTTVSAGAELSSLSLDNVSENLRANIRAQQLLGNHTLALEYSYRDRLYNGSLGFQDVRSNIGAVLLSPRILLNQSGLTLNYQMSAQYITSETDRGDLLGPNPPDNLVSLGRFQGNARLSQGFTLWQGQPLPATPTEGLRYSPFPIIPQVSLSAGLQGTATYYTSGDFQELIAGDIRIDAQFGHLSRNTFDYTRFNIGYYKALVGGDDSPFTFDRNVDRNVLSFGLMQQVYGPFLLGFQTSLNLDTGRGVNTEIIAEYSRRTYGILLRYSPTQTTGAIGFRLSNFNWLGSGDPFDNPRFRTVESGVIRQ